MATENQFKNDQIEVTVGKKPGCLVELSILALPKHVVSQKEKAFKNIRKEVSIPGFRKGKVPKEQIEQKYAKEIEREWRDLIVQSSAHAGMKLSSLHPYNRDAKINVDISELTPENTVTITVEFEIFPEVPSIEKTKLSLKPLEEEPVDEKKVDEEIEGIQHEKAEWEEVTDRPVEDKDYIDLDMAIIKEDGPSDPFLENRRFHLEGDRIEKWLHELVIGNEVGAVLEGEREEDDKSAPSKKIQVTIKAIQKATLPELDDDFAKGCNAKSVDELKEKIRERVQTQLNQKRQEKYRKLLQDQLIKNHPFEIPNSIVEKEAAARVAPLLDHLQKQNTPQDEVNKRKEEADLAAKTGSEESLRIYYLLGKFIGESDLKLEEGEVTNRAMQNAYQSMNFQALQDTNKLEQLKASARNELMIEKALDSLVEGALKS